MTPELIPWINMALNFLIVPALAMLHSISVTQATQTERINSLAYRVSNIEDKKHYE